MSWPIITDYQEAIQSPRLCFADPELESGQPGKGLWGLPKAMAGNFGVVFQMDCNGHTYAVKCFTRYHPDQEHRYAIISSHLQRTRLSYIVGFKFLQQGIKVRGQWYPILKMEWIDGESLNSYIEKNLRNPQAIQNLARRFFKLTSDLKCSSIAHGDLQHGNILIVNGDIRLIDYDGMFVPGLEGMLSHELGHRNYQHPRRTEQDFGPYLDNFSAWVIYVSLVALSIDSYLWHRLGAGEEHLLFRREDFENPDLSEALHALERIRDGTVQSLASFFHSLTYLDLSQIPHLDGTQNPQVISTHVSATEQPSWLSDYVKFQTPAQAPVVETDSSSPGFSWIMNHIEQVSSIHIGTSCITERFFLGILAAVVILLVYAGTSGLVAPTIAASTIGGGFALLLFILTLRFRFLSEVSKKFNLLSRLHNLQKEIKQIENAIKRGNDDKNKQDEKERQKVSEIISKQSECAQKERTEINKVDHELQSILARINSKRQPLNHNEKSEIDRINIELQGILANLNSQRQMLNQVETNEIEQALRKLQSQYLIPHLANYDLNSANISGIGSELKRRLVAKGIRTAADIANVHIAQTGRGRYWHEVAYIEVLGRGKVYVEGVGPKKVQALLSWRRDMESKFKSYMPQSLPTAQEAEIKSKYQTQRHSLDLQENNSRQSAKQKEAAIRSKYQVQRQPLDLQENNAKDSARQRQDAARTKYQQEQGAIAKQLQDIQDQLAKQRRDFDQKISQEKKSLPEKSWELAKLQHELRAYQQVNFAAYVKRVLFFVK